MELVLYPDPVLLQVAREVEPVDDEIRARAREMIEIMYEKRGIGLAANQVGWLARLIVVNPTFERGEERVLINPVIEARKGIRVGEEGCLSFPGVYGEIERSAEVKVRARDLSGAEILVVLNGSPFELDKGDTRLNYAVARVVETGLPLIYVNQIGGQDELVFDGASFVLGGDSALYMQAPSWREDVTATTWRR